MRSPIQTVDVDRSETWTRYRAGMCDSCPANCCTMPLEGRVRDLVRLGLVDTFEAANEDPARIAKRLQKARVIDRFNSKAEIFTMAHRADGDCTCMLPFCLNANGTRLQRMACKLIGPFMLRRTKSQVLSELPSRTEILRQVELSKEEAALYEALRRQALERLASSEGNAGQRHIEILAEIMKLRRACCNPNLVAPALGLPSSKLAAFVELLDELLANRHKALVFSQFVDHLSLIRAELEARGVRYQYLDGSTPMQERKLRVDAFQAGEGDVFLISLKAGGTGLNLTAADYVIHMDPWWNPAVEDQASDRAHCIDQTRPVTIYRLVAQQTIEEKIVDLHKTKRALADSLLEGSDMAAKISAEDMLALLREEWQAQGT